MDKRDRETVDGWDVNGERMHHGVFTLRISSDGCLIIHHGDAYGETVVHATLDVCQLLFGKSGLRIIGPDEARVLDACKAMQLSDDDPDADPLEPQEHGEDCYICTDDQYYIAKSELVLRAAKGAT